MSNQLKNTKSTSKRFPLRLVPEDRLTMERTLGLTVFDQKSAMVRAALSVFKQVWDAKAPNNRIILRDENSKRQYGVLITRASHEFAEKDDLFVESKLANKDEIYELRLSSADINVLEQLIDAGAAATFSQAIRRALALYAHVVAKYSEGYRLAAQTPSGEVLYLNVPGVHRVNLPIEESQKPLVFILDDNKDMRKFWRSNFVELGASTQLFKYEKNLGLEKNLSGALDWANGLVEDSQSQTQKVGLVVDLCWEVKQDFADTENVEEWGIIPKDEARKHYVAGYAGFRFIESLKDRGWPNDVPIFLVTKHVSELELRQGVKNNPNFAPRLREFDRKTKDLWVIKSFYDNEGKPQAQDVKEMYERIAAKTA